MKKLALLFIVPALLMASCKNQGETKVNLKTYMDSLSYAIGNDIGKSFERSELDSLNINYVAKGIKDHFAKDTSIFNEKEVNKILMAFSMKKRTEAEAKRKAENKIKYKDNLEAGQKFLSENAKKDGVITTKSGLQYKVLKEGNGKTPTISDKVRVNYEGKLLDGTVFDSSYKRKKPAEFGVTQVIKGWTEALQLMKEGSEYELYIPYDLAYGDRAAGDIKPFSTLIFKVELLKILPKEKKK
ncbi:MAG: FKBP-type peptidyl-prolyl cis-trans isomerase [Bacteroidales bacterium]|nr:FKBP-type peptidyl-prolyl cis-trans isomerase [Bacteroidales bacterium]